MISALDDAIGDIHQKIKDLGIEEDTIIWFLSDNGGASYTHATDNGPLKLGKLTQFEGGVRVPFMMKWKGKVKAGTRYEYPVSSTDIYATSVAAAGGVLPSDRDLRRREPRAIRQRCTEQGAAPPDPVLARRPHLGDARRRLQADS